jgi:AhpD family alkylhydroperoxidase
MTDTVSATRKQNRILPGLGYIARRPIATAKLLLGMSLPADFRERIMLSVTQVNQCAFCSRYHTREALKAGVPQSEIAAILDAEHGGVPEEQQVAVLFAQHWADTQGAVDPDALERLEQHYDAAARANILLAIRFINTMNALMGKFER